MTTEKQTAGTEHVGGTLPTVPRVTEQTPAQAKPITEGALRAAEATRAFGTANRLGPAPKADATIAAAKTNGVKKSAAKTAAKGGKVAKTKTSAKTATPKKTAKTGGELPRKVSAFVDGLAPESTRAFARKYASFRAGIRKWAPSLYGTISSERAAKLRGQIDELFA